MKLYECMAAAGGKFLEFCQSETRFYDENQRFQGCSGTTNLKIFRPAAGYKGGDPLYDLRSYENRPPPLVLGPHPNKGGAIFIRGGDLHRNTPDRF